MQPASDPAAQWTGTHKGHAFFAYADNYLIDLKAVVILDVEATRAIRQAEVAAARTMIEGTVDCFGLKPKRLAADSAYGSAPSLEWPVKTMEIAAPHPGLEQIQARRWDILSIRLPVRRSEEHLPLSSGQDAGHARNDRQRRSSPLPGQQVRLHAMPTEEPVLSERAGSQIPRSIFEQYRDVARSLVGTELYERSRRERKKIEMLFAHLKRIIGLRRLQLRGPTGAKDEFLPAATVQNLRSSPGWSPRRYAD